MKQKFLTLMTLLFLAVTGAWADGYYTPTADEVIYLKDVHSSTATTAGYSNHAAIAWDANPTANSQKCGDPENNGAETSSKVSCYSIKGNSGKTITLTISGVSKLTVYHNSHKDRYCMLKVTPDGGTQSTMSGVKATLYSEFELDGTKSYTIQLQGTGTGSDGQDLFVYAVKLIKYVARTISTETFSGVKIGGTALTENAESAGYSVDGSTITLTDVAYVQPTNVTLTNHIVYTDETTEDKNVAVTFGETPVSNFWEGTATIGTTTYTVKVPYEAQSVTAVTINGTAISADDLATLTSTKSVSIDGSSLNGIGTINVTLSGGTTTVSRANSGNDAVFTFTLNGTDNYTVTVTGVKKTYAAIGSIVYYQKGDTKAEGAGTKSLTANGINFSYPSKNFDYGTARVTIGSDEYQPIKLSTGEAVTVTFPAYKKATKVKVYGWSADGSNGRLSTFKESSSSEKDLSPTSNANIFYANNDAASIYPSVYEYELDNWESLYFQGSGAQPFVVMDFVFADSRNALESFAFSGGNTSVYTDALTTFEAPTLAATYGGSDVLGDLTVTYASSNTAVATVDEGTGEVTLTGTTGTAKITATFAGNATYQEASANYTITVAVNPVGDHTLTWTLSPLNSASAELTSSQVSTSAYLTDLGTIDVSLVGFASSPSKASSRTAKLNRLAAKDDSKYVYVTFDVADGYTFTPSSIAIKVANVSNVTTFDAELVDENAVSVSETGKTFSSTDGTVETWTINNSDATKAMTGTVTLKIYAYSEANGAGSFRFGNTITIAGEVTEVVPVTTNCEGGLATFASTKALDLSKLPEGVKAYKVATAAGSSARLEEVTVAVAAGTGLIFKGTKDATYNIPVAESASTLSGNLLVGVTDAAGYTTTSDTDAYALSKSDGMLHPVAANVTIPTGKAYLPASYFASNARSISLVFDDETTGIGASLMNSERVNNEVYNLNGQRVAQPSKGLYIVNGRKVVIK